jgi:thioredoxin 2
VSRLDASGVIVTCPQCGRSNRLPFAALGKSSRCGQCKTAVSAPGEPIELQDAAAFDAAVNRYLVLKVNTDVLEDVAARFRIRSIPTLALLAEGREIERIAGARPAAEIESFAARALDAARRRAS